MANSTFDDKTLIAQICGTEEQRDKALRIFFCDKALRDIVINKLKQLGATTDDAKDAFQDALFPFQENIRRGRFDEHCSLRTYYLAIAKQLWFNKNRRRQNHTVEIQPIHYDEMMPSVEIIVINEERKKLIDKALSQIGERCKGILDLYKLSYNYQEVANTFGFSSPDMAKKESYRCRLRFREYIKSQPHLYELFKSMI